MLFDGRSLFQINPEKFVLEPQIDSKFTDLESFEFIRESEFLGIRKEKNKSVVFFENKLKTVLIPLPEEFDNDENKNISISGRFPNVVVLKGKNLFVRIGQHWKVCKLKGYGTTPKELAMEDKYTAPKDVLATGGAIFLTYYKGAHYKGALSKYDPTTGVETVIYRGGTVTSMVLDRSGDLWFTTNIEGLCDFDEGLHKYQNEKLSLISSHTGEITNTNPSDSPEHFRYKKTSSINWKFPPTKFFKLKFDSKNRLLLLTDSEGIFQIKENSIVPLSQQWEKRKQRLRDFIILDNGDIVLLSLLGIELLKR